MSLYKRLLKYQQTEERSNLENFSTEILCDFLKRLSNDEIDQFLRKVVFFGIDTSVFEDFVSNHKNDEGNVRIVWKTQYSITISGITKYPDLIGIIDHRPAIIIEVKIGAGFTHRTHQNDDGAIIHIPQLVDYGNWLYENNNHAFLLLLSHSTPPPCDFLTPGNKYGIAQRNHITWNQIYRWLNDGMANAKENCLVEDFKKYLLEQNMAIESPARDDFSVLELLVSGAGKRIGDMMKHIRSELEKKYKSHMSWGKEKSYLNDGLYTIEYKQKIVWSWVILESPEYAFIAWGICFPNELDEWEWRKACPTLPTVPFVFIGLFSDKTKIVDNYKANINLRPDGWHWNEEIGKDDSDLIGMRFAPLGEFMSFEKDTTKEVFDFIDSGFGEISELVNKIVVTQ